MAISEKTKQLLKTLGPGIMFAGTCIGGSHLVQSTRAGANYGFLLLGIILIANFFKYPFFEFASRYTNATGESVLEGYRKSGKPTIVIYTIITVISMFIITAAILMVTGSLLGNLFNVDPKHSLLWITGLSLIVLILLIVGQFKILDFSLKIIGVVLLLSVVSATIAVLVAGRPEPASGFIAPAPFDYNFKDFIGSNDFAFIIGLMGWMPMGVDMSAWTSLWTQERIKQTGYHPSLKETLTDFNFGYLITVILAICFLTLGAYMFYGSNQELSNSGVVFAEQLVDMFTINIGEWSRMIIAAAAFSTMFGTSLTLVDGYSRSINRCLTLLGMSKEENSRRNLISWSCVIVIGGFIIILLGTTIKSSTGAGFINFKSLIDFATALSFVIAPAAAFFNYKIIFNKRFPASHLPSNKLKILALVGIIFLSVIALLYLTSFFMKF